ncbi:hypothetical protein BH10ACI2_BH10ACI2_05370 [soil metagenome]
MKILTILLGVVGLWFIASAATEQGLLPSGHGWGRLSEIILGLLLVAYSVFKLTRSKSR